MIYHFIDFYCAGVDMPVLRTNGTTNWTRVYSTVLMNTSDTPARAKVDGTDSFSCENHPYPLCDFKSFQLVEEEAFNPNRNIFQLLSLAHANSWEYICSIFHP